MMLWQRKKELHFLGKWVLILEQTTFLLFSSSRNLGPVEGKSLSTIHGVVDFLILIAAVIHLGMLFVLYIHVIIFHRYKFSWSPTGALNALTREANFLVNGKEEKILGKDLLYKCKRCKFNKCLTFDAYPNGNSTQFFFCFDNFMPQLQEKVQSACYQDTCKRYTQV